MSAVVRHDDSPPALDELESFVLDHLRRGETDFQALRNEVERRVRTGEIYVDPPPIDPSEPRRSAAELLALIDACDETRPPAAPTLTSTRTRAGYALESDQHGHASVIPALAMQLRETNLRERFADLWSVDLSIFNQLGTGADPRALAMAWLESPGRRLAQDIGYLRELHATSRANDLGTNNLLQRVYEAVGAQSVRDWFKLEDSLNESIAAWRELHATLPGRTMEKWAPMEAESSARVLRALELLERGTPLGMRGAALCWLLRRAANDPIYVLDGVQCDLSKELDGRLTAAFADWFSDKPRTILSRELEALTLQHAALITADDTLPGSTIRTWSVARWLGGCLSRSPWFGGDEEILVAHLRALLPTSPPPVSDDLDALHPARFGITNDGLDPGEVAWLSGVLYGTPRTLVPMPIVHVMRTLATRRVQPMEELAESARERGTVELEWHSTHVAPPLVAQRFLTQRNIAWLGHVSADVQFDLLSRYERQPVGLRWVGEAIFHEGEKLAAQPLEFASSVFRHLSVGPNPELRANHLATLGVGLSHVLRDDELIAVTNLDIEADWKPFVLDALASRAEKQGRDRILAHAIEKLLNIVDDTNEADKNRLNAALFAIRNLADTRLAERNHLMERLGRATSTPPFSSHLGLRRELRRLGIGSSNSKIRNG